MMMDRLIAAASHFLASSVPDDPSGSSNYDEQGNLLASSHAHFQQLNNAQNRWASVGDASETANPEIEMTSACSTKRLSTATECMIAEGYVMSLPYPTVDPAASPNSDDLLTEEQSPNECDSFNSSLGILGEADEELSQIARAYSLCVLLTARLQQQWMNKVKSLPVAAQLSSLTHLQSSAGEDVSALSFIATEEESLDSSAGPSKDTVISSSIRQNNFDSSVSGKKRQCDGVECSWRNRCKILEARIQLLEAELYSTDRKRRNVMKYELTSGGVRDKMAVDDGLCMENDACDILDENRHRRMVHPGEESPLRASRELLDLIPHIVFVANEKGEAFYCNEAWYAATGFVRGAPDQFDWHRVLHPEEAEQVASRWEKAVRDGAPYIAEHRCLHLTKKSTENHWYLVRAKPLRDKVTGKVTNWIGTWTEVTDLKEAQRELILMQQRTNAVVRNCCAILWAVDTDGIYTFHEGLTASRMGIMPSDRVGKSMYELYGHESALKDTLKRTFAGETIVTESEQRGLWLSITCSPLYDESGQTIIGCVGVTVDITERKKQALEVLKWEQVFTSSRSGMAICGPDGIYTNINPAFADMHRGSVESFVGLHLNSMLADESKGLLPELTGQFQKTRHVTYEAVHRRRDGTTFPVLTDCTGVCDSATGKVLFGLVSYIDLTETKIAEEERAQLKIKEQSAIQASELKTQFLAMMSHEIRTPLNGIIGMVDLAYDLVQAAEAREYLDTARQSASSLLTIINDILDLSKIEAGKMKLELIDFDFVAMIGEVIAMFSFSARAKGIFLEAQTLGLDNCYLKGDPVRLRQILTNLINNAIKFTSKGGVVVTLETVPINGILDAVGSPKMRKVTLSVIDTGVGISADILPTLFQPFSQADLSTTRKFGGTGLGLSISRQLISLMDGEIYSESIPGAGSRFWFSVDLEEGAPVREHRLSWSQQDSSDAATNLLNSKSVSGVHRDEQTNEGVKIGKEVIPMDRPANILVVDDNKVNQLVTSKLLERLGYKTKCASSGAEALEALHIEDFDLVLMDCHMPEMDGYETTRLLRKSPSAGVRSLPVVALTANALMGEKDKCLACGMNDYLCKPVSRQALQEAVTKWTVEFQKDDYEDSLHSESL